MTEPDTNSLNNSPDLQVSIIVLSYKNLEYLNTCLDSVFAQTYSNIELIVSNDGADNFSKETIQTYINKHKKENITQFIINKNPANYGTVKHCNIALDLCHGDYIMFIACDDAYSNENVIQDMVDGFTIVDSDVLSIIGQTAMYDKYLQLFESKYVSKETQRLINTLSSVDLYRQYLVLDPLLPAASIIYKREVFERYGRFDERFHLIEDWSSSIQFTKQGMPIYYLDILCVDHRDGGISHNLQNPASTTNEWYKSDILLVYKDALKDPEISDEIKGRVRSLYQYHQYEYEVIFVIPQLKPLMRLIYQLASITKYRLPVVLADYIASIDFLRYFILLSGLYLLNYAGLFRSLPHSDSYSSILGAIIACVLLVIVFSASRGVYVRVIKRLVNVFKQ